MKRYLTDETRRFESSKPPVHTRLTAPEMQLVKVYPGIKRQHIIGFGAALTEAAGCVYANMDAPTRERFIALCFGRTGNRYSLARTSIQSCDFSLVPRAYLQEPDDTKLASFSLEDDFAYVVPLALAAARENPAMEFLASPWSPPAWAKTNKSMKHGGKLRRKHRATWARMITRYVTEYRALGIPVTRLTMQNEPQASQPWESCLFTGAQEREFLHDYLKPALREVGLDDVKVLGWDHNKEGALDRAAELLADSQAARDLDGIAFHWYSGDHFEAVRAVRELIGDERELVFSEGCDAYSAGDPAQELPHAEHYAHEIIGDLEAGANGILDWNILLDSHGGPNHVGNFCDAPIMFDATAQELRVRLPFHYLGHFSRFIQPGARRILCTRYTTDLETCAFENPDGSRVLVALNRTDWTIPFDITWGTRALDRRIATTEAPPHSIQTIVW